MCTQENLHSKIAVSGLNKIKRFLFVACLNIFEQHPGVISLEHQLELIFCIA